MRPAAQLRPAARACLALAATFHPCCQAFCCFKPHRFVCFNPQILNLDDNQLTGSIPVFTFDTAKEFYGLTATNNNFSGSVPAWPDAPKAVLGIFPGSPGVCGAVGAAAAAASEPAGMAELV